MAVPKSTPEQREAALAKAAAARRLRAELKELLKTGTLTLPKLFERADADELVAGMKVYSLVASVPGVGKVKAGRIMQEIGIADNRRIRGLSDRQRQALLDALS
ncbi:MAG: integration host factor [Acidimicrobiia bacterium]|nr:integration host factor [Acidimicrobiia bacterium]MBT8217554.1 integration host factor [Acidimicrobiia bacterium]NNF11136.1 integration host factor [Acidimicrobiia bacterium]NNL68542.1 integration host factor [Acidimicrobiia bacterium]